MWAVVKTRDDQAGIEAVLIAPDREAAVGRAVLLAADSDLFDRWDEAEEERLAGQLRRLGDLVFGDYRITIVRAFHA
jgi:hypothetical protein